MFNLFKQLDTLKIGRTTSNRANRVIFTSTDNFIIVSSDNYIITGVE